MRDLAGALEVLDGALPRQRDTFQGLGEQVAGLLAKETRLEGVLGGESFTLLLLVIPENTSSLGGFGLDFFEGLLGIPDVLGPVLQGRDRFRGGTDGLQRPIQGKGCDVAEVMDEFHVVCGWVGVVVASDGQ